MDGNPSLDTQLIVHRKSLENEHDFLLRKIQDLKAKQAEIERQIEAVDVLLSGTTTSHEVQQHLFAVEEVSRQSAVRSELAGKTVVEACSLVLAREGKPMAVAKLVDALVAGGIRFRTEKPDRSVAVQLARSDDFVRISPGVFTLAGPDQTSDRRTDLTGMRQGAVIRLNKEGVVKGAERVLVERGTAMHVRDIYSALQARGFTSRAKRPQAMVSGSLSRSKRFRLIGGDVWDLVDRDGVDGTRSNPAT